MLVIFDLDGTLIDTPMGIVQCLKELALLYNKSCDEEFLKRTVGLPLLDTIATLLGDNLTPQEVEKGITSYQEIFRKIVLPQAKDLIFPGVIEGLTVLREEGFSLVVATNKYRRSALQLLEASGLLPFFKEIYGADQVKNPKPSIEMGELILKDQNKEFHESIMVGDTLSDLKMAHGLGINALMVTYGAGNPDELIKEKPLGVFDHFMDVIAFIKERAGRL